MAKKKRGLFGLGSVESDAWKIGKGVAGAVLFDVVVNNMHGRHHGGPPREGGEGGEGGRGGSDSSGNPMQGMIEGIEEMTGMKGHPVMMTVAGLLIMQTEYREFGEGMAVIGAYNAVTSHPRVREWGGGMHGIGNHEVLAAIESGIQARIIEMKKEGNDALAEEVGEIDGGIESNDYMDIFHQANAM